MVETYKTNTVKLEAPTKGGFSLRGVLEGLPSLKELLNGALGGVKETISNSDKADQVKKTAVKDWLKANAFKITSGFLLSFLLFRELFRVRGKRR